MKCKNNKCVYNNPDLTCKMEEDKDSWTQIILDEYGKCNSYSIKDGNIEVIK